MGDKHMGDDRHITPFSYTIMILSMTITTSVFFLGWISFNLGLSLYQSIVTALIGNSAIALVMYFNGYPGVKYGINFPIQLTQTSA